VTSQHALILGAAIIAMFLLSACAGTVAKVDAVERGVVEPTVDRGYDETVKRWCRLPVDVHSRALERRSITARSLTDNCPEWRAIRDAFLGEQLDLRRE
jgi:hypothetical protein